MALLLLSFGDLGSSLPLLATFGARSIRRVAMSYERAELGYESGYSDHVSVLRQSRPEKNLTSSHKDVELVYSTDPAAACANGSVWNGNRCVDNQEDPSEFQSKAPEANPTPAPATEGPKASSPEKDKSKDAKTAADKKKIAQDQARARLKKLEKSKALVNAPVSKSTMFIDTLSSDQRPGMGAALSKFGNNKTEAGNYMKLYPLPSVKNRPTLLPEHIQKEQDAWKANLATKEVPTLRKEMREKEVGLELADYKKKGIPPDFALSTLREEGKIEWDPKTPMPKNWADLSIKPKVKFPVEVELAQKPAATLKNSPAEASSAKAVLPPEIKDNKWAGVFMKHLPEATKVIDNIYKTEGKGGPSASASPMMDKAWSLPGASAMSPSGDSKVEDALSLERNRMRGIGFGDPEIADYQNIRGGRSFDQVQASFPPPQGKKSWMEAGKEEKTSAVKRGQTEQKEFKFALEGEKGRMKAVDFTDTEIQEFQRQNSGRDKGKIATSFSANYADGTRIPQEEQVKKADLTREKMRERMTDDAAKSLRKIDPNLSEENARLMAQQAYRERMGKGASEPAAASVDGLVAARKDVENDLHFMSEKPDRIGKLKARTAVHERNKLYDDVRAKAKADKNLGKMFGDDAKGQENVELVAASHGVDMADPQQIAKFRKEGVNTEKLDQFSETYSEAPKGKPENKARAELISKYKSSPSGGDTRERPDFSKIKDRKVRAQAEVNFDSEKIKNDWATIRDEKQNQWRVETEGRQVNREIAKDKRDKSHQLAFAAVQHEMQKDQTTHSSMLQMVTGLLSSMIGKLQDATLKNLEHINNLTAQLVMQGHLSAKDLVLSRPPGGHPGRQGA